MIRRFLLVALFALTASTAHAATTYYVRVAGGTGTQCNGTANVDYSAGVAPACAWNHPAWALGTGDNGTGVNGIMVGGDTLIINDNAGAATYMIGYGMPNTLGCTLFSPVDWTCTLKRIPSGPDAAHPTKILGSAYNTGCATKPQLWGTNSVGDYNKGMLNLWGNNNIDIECLELTDHSNCGFRTGNRLCNDVYNGSSVGTYARGAAIASFGGSNYTFKNVDVHGMATDAFHIVGVTNITFSHVNMVGNHQAGWEGSWQNTSADSMNGVIAADHTKVDYNGCSEAYPRTGTMASILAADYADCTGDPASGAYSDGWGFSNTTGTFIITDSEWSHNMSDGLDLLYGQNNMDISIDRSVFEGNNGNQLKLTGRNVNLTNSILIGNCNQLSLAGKVAGGDVCRAGGVPLAITPVLGSVFKFTNNTIYAATDTDGSAVLEATNRNGSCNGTETYTHKNDIYFTKTTGVGQWVPYYSGLTGACQTAFAAATTDHSVVYNFQTNPSGTGNSFTAPSLTAAISPSASSNLSNITLTSNLGGAASTTYWNSSNDYNNYRQNSSIDQGAIQFGSSLQLAGAGQTCAATSDCASGTCSNFACTGGTCLNNGVACSGTGTSSTCCSTYCNGSTCANPPICGNNAINPGEVCDGTALNGLSCVTQGFKGGTLACASNCLSYDTSSCNNTNVFPFTPIIDSFNRADENPLLNSTYWTTCETNPLKLVSNQALPSSGISDDNGSCTPAITGADWEYYITIATKGGNNDFVNITPFAAGVGGYNMKILSSGTAFLRKIDSAGTITVLGTYSITLSNGDTFGIRKSGTLLTLYQNGAEISGGGVTDSSYNSSTNIVEVYLGTYSDTSEILDNFGGGALNPITCGNNLKEGTEACDGTDLAGQSCTTKGYASGTLSCATNCQSFVTSSCVSATSCGNNTKEIGEVCDGTDLASGTCAALGFTGGTLYCKSDCLSYDTGRCSNGRGFGTGRAAAVNRGFVL